MCRICVKYGAGTKWYLNPKNYSDEVVFGELTKVKMEDTIAGPLLGVEGTMQEVMSTAQRFNWEIGFGEKIDLTFQDMHDEMATTFREGLPPLLDQTHAGQVVPLEDAEKIIDLVRGDILLNSCICRKYYGGKEVMSCMYFNPVADGMEKNIPWYVGKRISKEEAKELLREFDKKGIFHGAYWLPIPVVGCICNCEYPYCIALRARLHYDITDTYRKGEYVALVDANICNGCSGSPSCISKCGFGALRYSPTQGKVIVNQLNCWGCGVCRQACSGKAINLIPREEIPQLKDEW